MSPGDLLVCLFIDGFYIAVSLLWFLRGFWDRTQVLKLARWALCWLSTTSAPTMYLKRTIFTTAEMQNQQTESVSCRINHMALFIRSGSRWPVSPPGFSADDEPARLSQPSAFMAIPYLQFPDHCKHSFLTGRQQEWRPASSADSRDPFKGSESMAGAENLFWFHLSPAGPHDNLIFFIIILHATSSPAYDSCQDCVLLLISHFSLLGP